MHIICMFAAFLAICEPHKEYDRVYSQVRSEQSLAKMKVCATAIKDIKQPLNDDLKNGLYQRCLVQLKVTI